jgi:hypothetical protein
MGIADNFLKQVQAQQPSLTGSGQYGLQPQSQDWGAYLQTNPDVMQHWQNNVNNVQGQYQTPETWAKIHYDQMGQAEGRQFQTPEQQAASAPQPSVADSWSPANLPTPQAPAWAQGVTDNMLAQSQAASTQNAARSTSLFDALSQRANQTLNVGANDPIIRAQTDAYRAEQDRASRNDLADLAEKSGPYANLRGEQRLLSERSGQRTGGFQADLMGRELTARRAEISDALQSMGSLLSVDQQRELQREMTLLDQALAQQGMQAGQNDQMLDWQTALLANESFNKELGLKAEDRQAYYDALRRGLYRAEG